VLKKSKDIQVVKMTAKDLKMHAERITNLYQQVLKKSNFNIGIFTFETFLKLKENLNGRYNVFGYFIDNQLIGFRSSFNHKNILDTSFIGIDYKLNLKYNLYQRMLIDFINFGIENKVESIGFGRTAETIKCCVGAEPKTMNLFIKPRRKTGKFLLKMIVNNINPTEFSLRQPFKKQFYK
jgi:hypothetical protein